MVANFHAPSQVAADSSPGAKAARIHIPSHSNGESPAKALAKVTDKVCPHPTDELPAILYHLRLREKFSWWRKHCHNREVLELISHGVSPTWTSPPRLPFMPIQKGLDDQGAALQILSDYLAIGAVKQVPLSSAHFLVPWFVIRKPEGTGVKLRLICDCRKINQFLQPTHFKLDHIHNIFPFLRPGMWACKVDLKNAYFHLGLGDALKPYLCMLVGGEVYQFQGACFGLSTLPQLWMSVMKVFLRKWRKQGLMVFVYLDDILVLANSESLALSSITTVVKDLDDSGMVINYPKSQLAPVQLLTHLGFSLDLKQGFLGVPPPKLKAMRKELGKLVTHSHLSCRKMAAILGQVRSFLTAVPFLRAFTGKMVQFVNQCQHLGWDCAPPVPSELKQQVLQVKDLLASWAGRSFGGISPIRTLHSDSSTHAWGGLDLDSGNYVQNFWREKGALHINVKELQAAVETVKSLANPGELVHLCVDNSVAFSYLRKGGGRIPHLNTLMESLWTWCLHHHIQVEVELVKSADQRADALSRPLRDKGAYTLHAHVLHLVLRVVQPWVQPNIDMFASPGDQQFPLYVTRTPHWQAHLVDSLTCSLMSIHHCYANPPWKVIGLWLNRLLDHPNVTCLMVTPMWDSAAWWPLLLRLRVPKSPSLLIPPHWGMFSNCWGEEMPPTRWPLLCSVLSGASYKKKASPLKPSTLW